MKIWKISCLVISLFLFSAGCLAYSYVNFQVKFSKKILTGELGLAEDILGEWEKGITSRLLKSISRFERENAFQRGWLLSRRGDYTRAKKEFRLSSLYNAVTLSLEEFLSGKGRESLEKLAEGYVKVLGDDPDDFRAKVNLEIVRLLQKQAKEQMLSSERSGGEQKEIRKFRPGSGDEEGQGSSSPGDQELRY